ncbi:leucine-rich repeat-containing protein 23-like [Cetorhinus maximus]
MSESEADTDIESRDDGESGRQQSGSEDDRVDQVLGAGRQCAACVSACRCCVSVDACACVCRRLNLEWHPLTMEILSESLSLLSKTGNALSHAYVRVDLKDHGLTDINAIRPFIHLRYVDVSANYLQDISPLANLSQLLWLCADENYLTSARIEEMPFLQVLSLAKNRVKDMEGIDHPLLEKLNLSGNYISEMSGLDPYKLTQLHTLELRGNLLETTAGLNLPNLRHLYLAGNNIRRLEGLEALTGLQTLHLRDNHLETLRGFSEAMTSLQYLNVRGNLIVKAQEVKHLQCLPALRGLIATENPCTEEESYRLDVLSLLRRLERLDKDGFTFDDRLEADEGASEKLEEEEEKAPLSLPTSANLHSENPALEWISLERYPVRRSPERTPRRST